MNVLGKNAGDFVAPLIFFLIVGCMIVPLPPVALDVLLVTNLLLALLLVIGALQIRDPLKIAALPSLLLLTTLFRLSLNLATSRAVLSTGQAGRAVEAFGSVVIQGSPIVGFVLFVLITFVQFIVVAKGAERVAEVSARFTLDAMPGKQMAVDAEIRSGLLDPESARRKRSEIQMESRFYGALDGAMKFVKGDAIAGVVITVVNIVGGLLTGVLLHHLDLGAAVSKYTLLTIGDGLLSQIPSLLNSVAAGLVVTRVQVDDRSTLSGDLLSQVCQFRSARALVSCAAILLGMCPGMPHVPLLIIGGFLLFSLLIDRTEGDEGVVEVVEAFEPALPPALEIRFARELAVALPAISDISRALEGVRSGFFNRWGIILMKPAVSLSDTNPNCFSVLVRGIEVCSISAPEEELLGEVESVLCRVADRFRSELVDDGTTRKCLDYVERESSDLVTSVVPGVVTLTQLTGLLRALLREEISIRHLDVILQAIAESSGRLGERMLLAEVRASLRHVISAAFTRDGVLRAVVLDPLLDLVLARAEEQGSVITAELINEIGTRIEASVSEGIVALASKRSRQYLRDTLLAKGITVPVLAHEEIAPGYRVEVVSYVEVETQNERNSLLEALAA